MGKWFICGTCVYARACPNDKGGRKHGRAVNFYNLWEND